MRWMLSLLSLYVAAATCPLTAGAVQPHEISEAPDIVLLDSLRTTFGGVQFDHGLHDAYAACTECHHHLTGMPSTSPDCKSCHRNAISISSIGCKSCHLSDRFSQDSLSYLSNRAGYHIDIAGLKGAYHLRCLGCHLSLTAGPTGCRDCHQGQGEKNSLIGDGVPADTGKSND